MVVRATPERAARRPPARSAGSADRYDQVVITVTDTIATAKQGDPFEEDTIFGPIDTRSRFDTVMGRVDSGHAEGASATTGGHASDVPVDYFVKPTLFADVTPDMRSAREEILGPVIGFRYETFEEAVEMATSTGPGIGYGVEGLAAYLTHTPIHRKTRNMS
jgi:aldehyde dehydrogenase (NAD+)